jgi:hypothetical protein
LLLQYGSNEMPFRKGKSGNPAGRQPGKRNRLTEVAQSLLDGEAERLSRKAIELALDGNAVALRMCLDRVAPIRRGRPMTFDIGPLNSAADLAAAQLAVADAMCSGQIFPEEAAAATNVLEQVGAAHERQELENRIAALETAGEKAE